MRFPIPGRKELPDNYYDLDHKLRRLALYAVRPVYELGLRNYFGQPHYHGLDNIRDALAEHGTQFLVAPEHRSWQDIPYTHMFCRDIL